MLENIIRWDLEEGSSNNVLTLPVGNAVANATCTIPRVNGNPVTDLSICKCSYFDITFLLSELVFFLKKNVYILKKYIIIFSY